MIYSAIDALLSHATKSGLIERDDLIYSRNVLLHALGLDSYELQEETRLPLEDVLKALLDFACQKGIISDTQGSRDLFDTALMGLVTPRPSQVIRRFWQEYSASPQLATDYFYTLCQDCDYIRRYRIQKDVRWVTDTEYGQLDITINLSKPEKDPRDIAAARDLPKSGYPACLLCTQNEGYAGRADHPARQNHRIIPIDIGGQDWGFQYSPYVYYNEHCIVLNKQHVPMVIDSQAFEKLFCFVEQFPHYFVGSNADLPIVGGSILAHEHFQGGRYQFAMAKAPIERSFTFKGYEDVEAGIVKWPMSVVRLCHEDWRRLVQLGANILDCWRGYSDESVHVRAFTGDVPHNTVTPIARKNGKYELDLVLRNNRTTQEYPMGLFHPHQELHNIKRENIGLIEVMGLAVLPARLKSEMERLKSALLENREIAADPEIEKHAQWCAQWLPRYKDITPQAIDGIIKDEIGRVFSQVLSHAGVFKRTPTGQAAFDSFLASVL